MKIAEVKLTKAGERMPHPFNPDIDFPADGVSVDIENPVWASLIRDGSLTVSPDRGKKEKA